jgi:hypothetical protein
MSLTEEGGGWDGEIASSFISQKPCKERALLPSPQMELMSRNPNFSVHRIILPEVLSEGSHSLSHIRTSIQTFRKSQGNNINPGMIDTTSSRKKPEMNEFLQSRSIVRRQRIFKAASIKQNHHFLRHSKMILPGFGPCGSNGANRWPSR